MILLDSQYAQTIYCPSNSLACVELSQLGPTGVLVDPVHAPVTLQCKQLNHKTVHVCAINAII